MTTNYSLYSIPMYWLLAFLPRFYALNILSSANVKLHNVSPRSAEAHAKYKRGLSPRAFAAFERAEAAHANAFESAAFWVGAVVVGNWVGIGAWTMNYYSATYLSLRIAHLIAYLKIDSPNMAGIRSFFWGAATVHPLMLLIQAANKLATKTTG